MADRASLRALADSYQADRVDAEESAIELAALARDDLHRYDGVVACAVLLCGHCDSGPIGPFAGS